MASPHILSLATGILQGGEKNWGYLIKKWSLIRTIRDTFTVSSADMLRPSRKMVFFDEHYYIFRILLTAHGLWPYQTSKVMQMQAAFFFGVYSFFLFFQVPFEYHFSFATEEIQYTIIVNCLSVSVYDIFNGNVWLGIYY